MIKVNDIYKTIQGEGRWAGTPMVLLRLHGCSVGCSWCDTKQSWSLKHEPESSLDEALGENQKYAEVDELVLAEYCRNLAGEHVGWVMVTGGEPCQQNLDWLCRCLKMRGFGINLETSGTGALPQRHLIDWLCVSPKYAFQKPTERAILTADEVKLVVCTDKDLEKHLTQLQALKAKGKTVSLQPVSGSKTARDICIAACLAFGFNLSIQIHKEINLP